VAKLHLKHSDPTEKFDPGKGLSIKDQSVVVCENRGRDIRVQILGIEVVDEKSFNLWILPFPTGKPCRGTASLRVTITNHINPHDLRIRIDNLSFE
jgi:hypothetical protein